MKRKGVGIVTEHRNLFEFEELFRQFFRTLTGSWNKFNDNGMTAAQGFFLEKLELEGPLKVSQIAEALCYTSGAITALTDKMIAGGYVERERTEEDRRVVYLNITEEGRQMLGTIRARRKANIQKYFGDLPDEDIEHLIRIFKEVLSKVAKEQS
jgi:DNA-binding MarR family transcriptional regulator